MPRKTEKPAGKQSKWELSVVEHWCLYSRQTGFQPTGPHRKELDELFYRHWNRCRLCRGVGIVDAKEPTDWRNCPICQGMGGFYSGSKEKWREFIFLMMSEYPEYVCGDRKDEYVNIHHRYLNS